MNKKNLCFACAVFVYAIVGLIGIGNPNESFAQTVPYIENPPVPAAEGIYQFSLPIIGTITTTTRVMVLASTIAAIVVIVAFIAGIIILLWSVLGRYKKIPRDAAFADAWRAVHRYFLFFSGVTIVYIVISNLFGVLMFFVRIISPAALLTLEQTAWYPILSWVIGFCFYSYALAFMIATSFSYVDSGSRTFRKLLIKPMRYVNFLVANVLYTAGIIIGFVLLVFPGIWYASRYFYWPYILLSKDISFLAAFHESSRITRGAKFEVFLFWYLTFALTALGTLIAGIGYLIAYPFAMLAAVYLYRKVSGESASSSLKGE